MGDLVIKEEVVNIEARLPMILDFGDYHEINYLASKLSKLFGKQIDIEEVAFDGYHYLGLVYSGRRPAKLIRQIKEEYRHE